MESLIKSLQINEILFAEYRYRCADGSFKYQGSWLCNFDQCGQPVRMRAMQNIDKQKNMSSGC
ncbi:hypothetical protein CS542_10665 [Pedobacter sp. IW39]|nr:hypothetical protein CS542_10665 [Pedobacter sp. IW39]